MLKAIDNLVSDPFLKLVNCKNEHFTQDKVEEGITEVLKIEISRPDIGLKALS